MIPFYEANDRLIRINHSLDMTFPPHLHSQLEILYLLEGELEVSARTSSRLLLPGDLALLFPNVVHGYHTREAAGSRSVVVICDPSWTMSWLNTVTKYEPGDPFLPARLVHGDIRHAMNTLLQERETASPELCKAYIQLILARSIPSLSLIKHTAAVSNDVMARVIRYLSEHYSQPITLDQLAADIGVSKYHLSRVFSQKFQTSFTDYLNSFRIGLARSLLETSDLDILDICFRCGFDSQRTFNRAFKGECGCSPREYRKKAAYQPERDGGPGAP